MKDSGSICKLHRRQFGCWLGYAAFAISQGVRANATDDLSSVITEVNSNQNLKRIVDDFVHWTAEEDEYWRWFRKEMIHDGVWSDEGITLPVNKKTNEPYEKPDGYLDPSDVPEYASNGSIPKSAMREPSQYDPEGPVRMPSLDRRINHGKPPSEWVRDLYANELRPWLKTLKDIPEASVGGMTVWVHLTRDHLFDAKRLEGLTKDELDQLHSATHYGY